MSKNERTIVVSSAVQMRDVGKSLGKKLYPGLVICLVGDLGVGKTTFVQGLAKGLGIKKQVSSPTFQLLRVYSGRLALFHFDLYRLKTSLEWEDLGYEEYFFGSGVTVMEWAEKVKFSWPEERLEIQFQYLAENTRQLTFLAAGLPAKELLK